MLSGKGMLVLVAITFVVLDSTVFTDNEMSSPIYSTLSCNKKVFGYMHICYMLIKY